MTASRIIYLSLGSNVGDRAGHIARAVESLLASGVHPLLQSSLYLTEPAGGIAQRPFLNAVLQAETSLMPLELLHALQRLERALGRRPSVRQGPRAIDIDILFYGTSVIRTPELEIPHSRLADRRFVLVPLNEIAPDLRHPVLQRSVSELLGATSDRGFVRLWRAGEEPAG